MNFFFDRNVGVRIARMLNAFDSDHQVTHHDDDNRFSEHTRDTELICILQADEPPPVFITADMNMRKRPEERLALKDSALTVVFLKRGFISNLSFHAQAVKLLRVWPDIVAVTTRCKEPTAFEVAPKARKVDRIGHTRDL